MENLTEGNSLKFEVKKGFCDYSVDQKAKILISTGTGIAPHLSLLEEMRFLGIASEEKLVVLFGCRFSKHDHICEHELKKLAEEKQAKIFTAFSRDQSEKKYVQHFFESEEKIFLKDFIEKNFKNLEVYVCGNSKFLPKAIERFAKESFEKDLH